MQCAACCFSTSVRHVRVTGDDYARLGDEAERLVTWLDNQAFMRLEPLTGAPGVPPRCAALTIDMTRGRFSCEIYERRPHVCRDLQRGGGA